MIATATMWYAISKSESLHLPLAILYLTIGVDLFAYYMIATAI